MEQAITDFGKDLSRSASAKEKIIRSPMAGGLADHDLSIYGPLTHRWREPVRGETVVASNFRRSVSEPIIPVRTSLCECLLDAAGGT